MEIEREAVRRAFARTIRELRLSRHTSQEELALLSGIDRGYMGGLERGQHSPTLETILKLLPPLKLTFVEFAAEFERVLRRQRRQKDQTP